jgi:glyoxylase-like metal-dependent hydrolase (beta-lactamase superfamily II)
MNICFIKQVTGVLIGSFILFSSAYGQVSKPIDTIQLKPVQVAPHTYFVQGFPAMGSSANQNFISNAGFVVTSKGVVVVDALGSPILAQKLIAEIKKITPQKVVALIVSHYHADHVYGLQEFKSIGAKIYAQGEGRNYISSETAKQRLIASRIDFAPWVNADTKLISADVWIDQKLKFVKIHIPYLKKYPVVWYWYIY